MGSSGAHLFTLLLVCCVAFYGVNSRPQNVAEEDQKLISEFLQKYNQINVIDILSNERLFQAYHKCFLGQAACSPEARDMKKIIPILVRTACESCSVDEKKEMKKHLNYLQNNRDKEWNELLEAYDPNRQGLEKFLASVPE